MIEGVKVKYLPDGFVIELKGEIYSKLGKRIEKGEVKDFYKLLKTFVRELGDIQSGS